MKKWIQFNIDHPKIVLLILLVITLAAGSGLAKIYFDSSTETVMPKKDMAYKLGLRAKKIFSDTKTYMLTAIEPLEGKELLSNEVFSHLDKLVTELEEFYEFDFEQENKRLALLLELSNVSPVPAEENTAQTEPHEIPEAEPAAEETDPHDSGGADAWDLDKTIKTDFYAEPARPRNRFNYERFQPIRFGLLFDKLDPPGRRMLETITRYKEFGTINHDDILTRARFRDILETWETVYLYKSMEIIKSVMNPVSGEDIAGTEDELRPVKFLEEDENGLRILPETEEDFARYKEKIFKNPSFDSTLYSIDPATNKFRALAISLELRPLNDHNEIFDYLQVLIDKYNTSPVKLTSVGIPVMMKYVVDYMKSDLRKFMLLVFFVIIITFYLNFRLFRGVLLPAVSVGLASLWTIGLVGHLGIPITLVVNILPPLLVAIGSSYSIHIFNQYLHSQEEIHDRGKREGIHKSMSHISSTVMLAAFTTFIGFMTLTVNQVESLQHFGVFAAIGTLFSMVISVMLIPSALMLMDLLPKTGAGKRDETVNRNHTNTLVKKILDFFSFLSLKHSSLVVVGALVLIVGFIFGIYLIKVETAPLYNFKDDSYIYQSDMVIGELFKGSLAINVIIDSGRENGAKDPEFLSVIDEISSLIATPEGRKRYHFLHTLSFADVIKRMHKAMNGDKDGYYSIPESEETIREYLEIFAGEDRDSDGRPDSMERFVDSYYRYVNIFVRLGAVDGKLFSTEVNAQGQKWIRNFLANHPKARSYKCYFAGEPINMFALARLVVRGQLISIFLTLFVVALVIFLLFRNWQAALVSLIPISSSIIIIYGTMGYLGIPLDLPKALLAAMAIGIGVDDTIHMLKTLRHNLLKGFPMHEAMKRTYVEAGMAIVYTSIALIFGFSVLLLSEFKPIMFLGWLVASTMIATTIAALLLLPAVIIFFKIPLEKELDWAVFKRLNLNRFFELDE
ncbi:MAG: MMPL family transporter [bacterium]|nr:MMPL family transporter [bacterium]